MMNSSVKDFTFLKEMVRGPSAEVYKAKKGTDQICVLKKVQGEDFKDDDVEFWLKLKHENINQVLDVFKYESHIWVGMEFCDGGNLSDYFVKKKPEVEERYTMMVELAEGLKYLHSQGVIHQLLKPENILLKKHGGIPEKFICKISDYIMSSIKTTRRDNATCNIGNPGYIAPEVQDGKVITSSVDVFCLGLIYFAIFHGSVLKDKATGKALIPGRYAHDGSIEYLNDTLKNKNPTERQFLDDNFLEPDNTGRLLGALMYCMLHPEPELRPQMETVLTQVILIKNLQEENSRLQRMVDIKEGYIEVLKTDLDSQNERLTMLQHQLENTIYTNYCEKKELEDQLETSNRDRENLTRQIHEVKQKAFARQSSWICNRKRTIFIVLVVILMLVYIVIRMERLNFGKLKSQCQVSCIIPGEGIIAPFDMVCSRCVLLFTGCCCGN